MSKMYSITSLAMSAIGLFCVGLGAVNGHRMNVPDGPGILSREGAIYVLLPFGFGLICILSGTLHVILAKLHLSAPQPPNTPTDSAQPTLDVPSLRKILGDHANKAIAIGDTAEARRACDAADAIVEKMGAK